MYHKWWLVSPKDINHTITNKHTHTYTHTHFHPPHAFGNFETKRLQHCKQTWKRLTNKWEKAKTFDRRSLNCWCWDTLVYKMIYVHSLYWCRTIYFDLFLNLRSQNVLILNKKEKRIYLWKSASMQPRSGLSTFVKN